MQKVFAGPKIGCQTQEDAWIYSKWIEPNLFIILKQGLDPMYNQDMLTLNSVGRYNQFDLISWLIAINNLALI